MGVGLEVGLSVGVAEGVDVGLGTHILVVPYTRSLVY